MKEDTLFQFVGFETAVNLDVFSEQWENFARRFFKQDIHTITLQQQVKSKNRFKFMSMNEWPQDNFRFSFMDGRGSDYFPDHRVKVIQAGGYSPIHQECQNVHSEMKILLMLKEGSANAGELRNLPYQYLNIYQAYYESCLYSHIVEFHITEGNSIELYEELKKRYAHGDVGMYRECLVLEG